jgi:hypothetical protein
MKYVPSCHCETAKGRRGNLILHLDFNSPYFFVKLDFPYAEKASFSNKITPNVIARQQSNLFSLLINLTHLKNKIKFKDTYYAKKWF